MKRAFVAFLALALTTLSGALATANDEQIAKQIVDRLQQHRQSAQLQDFNIGVQVENGTVTMMGNVAASDHAVLALDIARRIPGVKLVINDLYVQAQTAGPASPQPGPATPAITAPPAAVPTATPTIQVPATPAVQQVAATGPSVPMQSSAGIPLQRNPQPTAQPMVVSPPRPQVSGAVAGFLPQQPNASQPVGTGVTARQAPRTSQAPLAFARNYGGNTRPVSYVAPEYSQSRQAQYSSMSGMGGPTPMATAPGSVGTASYDNPQMPGYAWPSYASYPNYAAVTYPHQYSATAWPYIGPFYPYPQVPLGWRKVMLEWDDGWWFLDFKSK